MSDIPFPRDKKHRRAVVVWDHLDTVGPASIQELAEALGAHENRISHTILWIRKKHPGRVRVCQWIRWEREVSGRSGGGRMSPVYEIGEEPDAKRPKVKSRKQIDRDAYLRKQALRNVQHTARRRSLGMAEGKPTWLRGLL